MSKPKQANVFAEEKELKKWAIELANALGGQRVEKTPMLTTTKLDKVTKLIDRFVIDHNENMIAIMSQDNKKEEE